LKSKIGIYSLKSLIRRHLEALGLEIIEFLGSQNQTFERLNNLIKKLIFEPQTLFKEVFISKISPFRISYFRP